MRPRCPTCTDGIFGKHNDDMQSAVLWSTSLQSSIRRTAKLGAVIGHGSGGAYQLALSGQGIGVVQASEGLPAPAVIPRSVTLRSRASPWSTPQR